MPSTTSGWRRPRIRKQAAKLATSLNAPRTLSASGLFPGARSASRSLLLIYLPQKSVSYAPSPQQTLFLIVNPKKKPKREKITHVPRTAITHQGQGQAFGRQQAEVHPHVD